MRNPRYVDRCIATSAAVTLCGSAVLFDRGFMFLSGACFGLAVGVMGVVAAALWLT